MNIWEHVSYLSLKDLNESIDRKPNTRKPNNPGPSNHTSSDRKPGTKPIKGGYVIATIVNDVLVFSSKPRVHESMDSVKTEMLRLAQSNPGVTFVSLKIDQMVVAPQVVWS
jgi:hypothetical protein